jgi:superfamily II DNA or RNA helicase
MAQNWKGCMRKVNAYEKFLAEKRIKLAESGISVPTGKLNSHLFGFQRDVVSWALRKGRAAMFLDCGMGKTIMQLEFAHHVPGDVLILAPLAVAQQTVRESEKFGIKAIYSRKGKQGKITVANYEMLEHFSAVDYEGIVLDESSILKSFDGTFRNQIISTFERTPFRLACTATPAPNDYMELGNHSEFLGALSRTEMLSTFFVHDGGDTAKWRLKRHAQSDFWKWVCSWAVMMRKPSDLGYPDDGFILPEMQVHDISIEQSTPTAGMLFAMPAATLQERRQARSGSVESRAEEVARIVATKPTEPWLIWCNLNSESDEALKQIPGAVEIRGANSRQEKEDRMLGFSNGEIRVLITKPSICGWGMNWQHCPNVVFYGLSDSYEQFYQAVRRCWRFGQKNKVNCYIVTSSNEGAVTENIKRKERDASQMAEEMVNNMHELNKREIHGGPNRGNVPYATRIEKGPGWEMQLGDCVELVRDLPSNSVHYSIFSPPFASLYTYSASDRDMGNCKTHSEFFFHFRFLVIDLFRAMMDGRLVSFHCMNLPKSKERDGVIGITDFRGDLIRIFEEAGFIYHSEVCIWKDPVTAMQRTKAIGLLHKQIKKDSTLSRQGIPDYLVTMRKPGENPERVTHTNESFPVSLWQKYASPVWMDINPSNTLQRKSAREHEDERHICPLQLQVIQRAIALWTNPKDTILSPFAGIGSEGYVALQEGRKFLGFELKESYFKQACLNLKAAKAKTVQMFDDAPDVEAEIA